MIILLILCAVLSIFSLFLCAKKKNTSTPKSDSTPKSPVPPLPMKPKVDQKEPNQKSDEDDVKFNLNIKKDGKKEDDFDDDEENPLAKLELKKRKAQEQKLAPAKSKITAKQKTVSEDVGEPSALQGGEEVVLGPNEQLYGMSCYQFDLKNKPKKGGKGKAPVKAPVPKKAQKEKTTTSIFVPPAEPPPPVAPSTMAPPRTTLQTVKTVNSADKTMIPTAVSTPEKKHISAEKTQGSTCELNNK